MKRGERAIKILAPAPYKVRRQVEKLDASGRPIPGPDGKPLTVEKEITVPAFKVVSVFDVSQTEGREIPDIAVDELTGSVERYQDFFAALERTSPVPIAFENIESGAHGYYHLEEKRIAIDEGMTQGHTDVSGRLNITIFAVRDRATRQRGRAFFNRSGGREI